MSSMRPRGPAGAGVAALVFIALGALLARYYAGVTVLRHLDSVFLFEAVDSILAHGIPTSSTVQSWLVLPPMLDAPAAQVCAAPLPMPAGAAYNVLHNHSYFALYPIALLAVATGVHAAFAILNAAAHVLLLALPFAFLRRRGASVPQAAAFVVLVACWPAWSLSAVGDYYLDRLYMPLMLAVLYLLHERVQPDARPDARPDVRPRGRWRSAALPVLLVAASALTERAAIMVLAAVLYFGVVFALPRGRVRSPAWLWIGVPVVLAAALIAYFTLLYQGFEGGGSLTENARVSPRLLLERLADPRLVPFVLTNLLFTGWLAIIAGPRLLVLLVGAMLPNVLVTIGGAELTGWTTHYHAMYMPFAVFAATIGWQRLLAHAAGGAIARRALPAALAGLAVLGAAFLDPYSGHFARAFAHEGARTVREAVWVWYVTPSLSSERAAVQLVETLDGIVPRGTRVSAVEGALPALHASRRAALFPVGLDDADYLVLSGTRQADRLVLSAATSYRGPQETRLLNDCLAQRAARGGFVPVRDLAAVGLFVLRRESR